MGALALLTLGSSSAHASAATAPFSAPTLPNDRLHFGIQSVPSQTPDDLAWMTSSGVPWKYRYTYLAGGVNTGTGWETWNSPAGAYALDYMTSSTTVPANYMPVLTYYEICQSNGSAGANPCYGNDPTVDWTNINSTSTMAAYYANFKLLMQQAAAYGKPVVVHVEPDFWAFMQQRAAASGFTQANQLTASVQSSGFADVNGYANNVQGFACALLHIRDAYGGGNVIMGIHASLWASGVDVGSDTSTTLNVTGEADKTATFLNSACISSNPYGGSTWDTVFNDVADHDAGWFEQNGAPQWWDKNNVTFPNFSRWLSWVTEMHTQTGRPLVVWQVPEGNQYFLTMNNTCGHYQDNRAEYFLSHTTSLSAAGIDAVLFGSGNACQTNNFDHDPTDGITNNNGVPTTDALGGCTACNTHTSTVADNDGGYLRMAVGQYYNTAPPPPPPPPAAVRYGGINAAPSIRPWRYLGPNPDGWYCVVPNCYQNADPMVTINTELSLAHALGAGNVRVDFPWIFLEPTTKGVYDWSRSDAIVAAANAHGVQLQGVVAYTPGWAASDPTLAPNAQDYYDFVHALVSRYKASVHIWELWNEPDGTHYWNSTQAQFVTNVQIPGYNAVKAADPSAKVMLTGPACATCGWIDGVYSMGGGNYFDIASVHDYNSDPVGAALMTHNSLVANGQGSKPIWLSEYGVNENAVNDVQQQAMINLGLTEAGYPVVAQWYALRDDNSMTCCPPAVAVAAWWGVVQHDDVTKKDGFTTMQNLLGGNPPALSASVAHTAVGLLGMNFTGGASGGSSPYWYYWDFGDGTSSTSQSPSHTYSAAGTYAVTFTVVDAVGRGASASLSLTLTGGVAPLTATAAASPMKGDAPTTVSFTGSGSGGVTPYTYSWNFGDGSAASTAQNPTHSYASAGAYTATLTVTDAAATKATATVTITVSPALSAAASASPTVVDVGDSVSLGAMPGGGLAPYTYSWNFGDGSAASTAQNPSHVFASAAQFTATVTVTDGNGARASASVLVTVHAAPTVSVTGNPTSGDAPVTTAFGATPSGGTLPYTYSWDFGDGTALVTSQNPSHIYTTAGTYTATLTVTDAVGHTVKGTVTVVVSPALMATAGATPTTGQAPLTVNLSATPSGGKAPYTYSWNFGDGSAASTAQNPSHVYASAGTFTASVTVTDANGASVTAGAPAVTATVTPLSVTASANHTAGDAPLAVSLTGAAAGGTAPVTYAWVFGDGTTGSGATPSHTYTAAGVFIATVTATDARAQTATATVTITVSPALTLNAGASPTTIDAGDSVSFASVPGGGLGPYTYSWNFGDGSVAGTTQNPSHTYASAGNYVATVTVTDANGATTTASTNVSVNPRPTVIAAANPTGGDAPVMVAFTASPTGGTSPYSFSWTFGDGSQASTTQNPSHMFAAAGSFTATVTLTDASGHAATSSVTIAVSPALGATAGATPTSGQAPLTVDLTATPAGGKAPYSYSWTFGDGTASSSQQNPVHQYASGGTFTASVAVTDAYGSTVTISAPAVTVTIGPLVVSATGAPAAGDAPVTTSFNGSAVGGLAPLTYTWTFGDGTTGAGATPTHTYGAPGTYTATLTVTDAAATKATATVTITVSPALSAAASASPTVVDVGDSVSLGAMPGGGLAPYTYSWNFGDGSAASTAQNPSHVFASAAQFTATVTVTDGNGARASASVLVTVHAAPTVSVAGNPTSGDAPVTTAFSATPSGGTLPYTYSWDFGDASALVTSQNPSHIYTTAGTYTATLTVTDAVGHTVKGTVTVVVSPALMATAGATPTTGQAPLTVNLSATPSGGKAPYTYSWNFGDGSAASTAQNPSHVYAGPGTFTASVTVTDANGVSVRANAPPITVTPAPLAALTSASKTAGDAPLTTTISGYASGGTAPYTYSWDLGDGGTSTAQTLSHSYGPGTYTVTLTVTDSASQTATSKVHLTVYPALTASAGVTPISGTAPLAVTLTATAGGGYAPYTYTWTFGDGTTATGASVTHAYPAGTFDPVLTVQDYAGGTWNALVARVTVTAPANSGGGSNGGPTTGGTSSGNPAGGAPPAGSAAGSSSASPSPTSSPSPASSPSPTTAAGPISGSAGVPGSGGGNTPLPLVIIGSLLATGVGGLIYTAWRRARLG